MTDGTSQGLFIVVAIVIFGIFVVLAYILFEDTLSPAMASMFNVATENSMFRLTSNNDNLFNSMDFEISDIGEYADGFKVVDKTHKSITINSKAGTIHGGVYIPHTYFERDTKYILEYDLTLLEGEIYRLGGHLDNTSYQNVFVNGEPMVENMEIGTHHNGFSYNLEKGETYTVRVEFERDDNEIYFRDYVHIQPNKQSKSEGLKNIYLTDYVVRIDNTRLFKDFEN